MWKLSGLVVLTLLASPALAGDDDPYDPFSWQKDYYDDPFKKPDRKTSPFYEDPIKKEDKVKTYQPSKPVELENKFSDGKSGKKTIGSSIQNQLKRSGN